MNFGHEVALQTGYRERLQGGLGHQGPEVSSPPKLGLQPNPAASGVISRFHLALFWQGI